MQGISLDFLMHHSSFSHYYSPRSKSGSRTGDLSSRNCTKTAKSPWSTVLTPATQWPATPRPPPQCGRTTPHRTPRSTDLRSRSRRTARRRLTWRIITTTGTSRDHTYSTRAPCTTQSLSKAWELFIDNDSRADSQFVFVFFVFVFQTRSVHNDSAEQRWTGSRPEVKHPAFGFWMIKSCFRTGFSILKAHKGFLITCGSIFNGQLAWFFFFKLFISNVVFP